MENNPQERSEARGEIADQDSSSRPPNPIEPTLATAPLKSPAANLLEVHGGFVLLLIGVGLIVLACLFADKATVAPIFAAFGAVLIILAAFYSRIEGNLAATKDGVRATVRAAQRKSHERELSSDLTAEAVSRAVDALKIPSRRPAEIQRAAEDAAVQAVDSVASEARLREFQILSRFSAWLETEGGFSVVRTHVRTPQAEYDLLADSSDTILMVEAKAGSKPVGVNVVRQVLGTPSPADLHERRIRRAVVVPADLKVTQAAIHEAKIAGVEIYEVWEDGRVLRVI
jgi:hypothetical protein